MTCRLRSERAGGGHTLGTEEGRCSARFCRRTGTDMLAGGGPGPRPGSGHSAARQRSAVLGPEPDGQEAVAPVAQGSRGQKVPQTLPSSDPAPAVRRAAMDNGQAGCGQHPQDARPSHRNRGPACLARPAWHRFLDTPIPREAASPHTLPGPGLLILGREHSPLSCLPLGAGLEAHSGMKQGWGIYFFSPFLFFNKKD